MQLETKIIFKHDAVYAGAGDFRDIFFKLPAEGLIERTRDSVADSSATVRNLLVGMVPVLLYNRTPSESRRVPEADLDAGGLEPGNPLTQQLCEPDVILSPVTVGNKENSADAHAQGICKISIRHFRIRRDQRHRLIQVKPYFRRGLRVRKQSLRTAHTARPVRN